MNKTKIQNKIIESLKENYSKYRLINVKAENALQESMRKYGQLSPVVISETEKKSEYEIIDGFKRLRAARNLGYEELKTVLIEVGQNAIKVAIIQLNWIEKSVDDFEEALILHSLFHEDGLTQVEISKLFNRHKSWVSRRISLVEQLSNEVQDQIKLGLITITAGRILTKLPRGNQESALATIQKYGLSSRETEKLVTQLLSRPKHEHRAILNNPIDILNGRCKSEKEKKQLEYNSGTQLEKKLTQFVSFCGNLIYTFSKNETVNLSEQEKVDISIALEKSTEQAKQVMDCFVKVNLTIKNN